MIFFCVKVAKIFISYCGTILVFFFGALYHVVQADGTVGAGVLGIYNLGDGTVIICVTLCVSGESTLGGPVSPTIFCGDFCTTLEDAPGFFRWD